MRTQKTVLSCYTALLRVLYVVYVTQQQRLYSLHTVYMNSIKYKYNEADAWCVAQ